MSSMVVVRKPSRLEHGHLVVVEINDLRGVLDDRAGIGRDDVFVLAHADDQRRALARDDQRVRLVLADDRDAVRAFASCSAACTAVSSPPAALSYNSAIRSASTSVSVWLERVALFGEELF